MKKFLACIGILALSLALFSAEAKKEKGGNAIIKFTEQNYNFGTINEAKGPVSHEFEFINTGNGNLVIIDATAECGCTRPEYPKNPVAPGKKGKVKVTYNPAGRPGSFDKVVTVRTNGNPKKVRLKIKGSVIPK
ncbi:MAG: DUF1573 domain-containing protein [Muribaculum sp.]|nr:DUF1573 domain-containing protein [Muribaculum sp.]